MNMKEAREKLTPIGVGISFNKDDDEYRVNFKGGREATAYYTNDLDDAVGTGIDMAKRGVK